MEFILLKKKREHYERELAACKQNYDLWFDYLRLEEQANEIDQEVIRDLYERAVVCQPLVLEKIHWKRYIYLWLNYAVFEESVCEEADKA
mmetsp:Transcript_4070/g.6886  ORF Transcript_4070/g.6886 Transcript_4070/m.6886 type:complete len:90 (-) Transcript_4070:1090-1359(-)